MIIIKIILWVLLAVLLIVTLALAIPVRFRIRYTDDVTVVIKYLFLKFTVVGKEKEKNAKGTAKNKKVTSKKTTAADKKTVDKKTVAEKKTFSFDKTIKKENISDTKTESRKKSDKKSRKKTEKKEENKAVKWVKDTFKEKGLKGLLNVFKEIAKLAGTLLKPIFRHIRIKNLDLNVTVAFEDAADTAINYGYFCSGIYPALAVLLRIMKYDDYSVSIVPDFDKKEPEFDIFADLSIIPWFALFGAVHALVKFLILKYKGKL